MSAASEQTERLAEAAAQRTIDPGRRVRDALRSQIEALRAADAAEARVPVRQRASEASLRARLRGAPEESQRQREEIARLREELALARSGSWASATTSPTAGSQTNPSR